MTTLWETTSWYERSVGNKRISTATRKYAHQKRGCSRQQRKTLAISLWGNIPDDPKLEPVAESSKGLQLVKQSLLHAARNNSKACMKQTGAALVKTSNSTLSIKYPGQDDTVLHKSDVVRFGTPAQHRIPLMQFTAQKTVINHHEKLQRTLNFHQKEQMTKLKGERTIRKRQKDNKKIEWLGFEINQHGIKPLVTKTEAIQSLKAPNTCKPFESFLGGVHHLTKFVPTLATQCRVFPELLKKDIKYLWTTKNQTAFEKIKEHIKNIMENKHYDPSRKTRVCTDASRSGLGAVFEQESSNGWETIAYASRFLNKAEEKNSINELELLCIVWSLKKWPDYA